MSINRVKQWRTLQTMNTQNSICWKLFPATHKLNNNTSWISFIVEASAIWMILLVHQHMKVRGLLSNCLLDVHESNTRVNSKHSLSIVFPCFRVRGCMLNIKQARQALLQSAWVCVEDTASKTSLCENICIKLYTEIEKDLYCVCDPTTLTSTIWRSLTSEEQANTLGRFNLV